MLDAAIEDERPQPPLVPPCLSEFCVRVYYTGWEIEQGKVLGEGGSILARAGLPRPHTRWDKPGLAFAHAGLLAAACSEPRVSDRASHDLLRYEDTESARLDAELTWIIADAAHIMTMIVII